MDSMMSFLSGARISCNMTTLTKHCILHAKTYFLLIMFLVFFFNINEKTLKNRNAPKIEKLRPVGPEIHQKSLKFGRKNCIKFRKFSKKVVF